MKTSVTKLRRQLSLDARSVEKAAERYNKTLAALQKACPHDLVAECDYQDMTFFAAMPPRRICETCGIEEEGWGCGYQVLTNDRVRPVSREELYQLRLGDEVIQVGNGVD
jgi:hypothetical protein